VQNRQAVARQPVPACQYKLLAGTLQAQINDSTSALVKQVQHKWHSFSVTQQ